MTMSLFKPDYHGKSAKGGRAAASCRAVRPRSVGNIESAPARRSARTTSGFPLRTAW
jgi:hypothetical protein